MERVIDNDLEIKKIADGALKQLCLSLQLIASTAQEQINHFPLHTVVVTDEIALDFDQWVHCIYTYWKFPKEQVNKLKEIDNFFNEMSDIPNNIFWTDKALYMDPRWNEVRNLAEAALISFGWPLVVPLAMQ